MAENTSTCPADSVPMQILAGRNQEVTTLSAAQIRDYPSGFSFFVETVTRHVADKLSQENLCLDNAESKERSLLQFVPLPVDDLVSPLSPVPPFDAPQSKACRISSPWIDLVIEREPVLSVRGFIRYSERQLLADQAVLDGAQNVPPGIAAPLGSKEFLSYSSKYVKLEVTTWHLPGQPVVNPVEKHVPPDLLWLFRHSTHSCFSMPGDFMTQAMERGTKGYTKIVTALIDRCFESAGADINYNSIMDIKDDALLDQYKVVTPEK